MRAINTENQKNAARNNNMVACRLKALNTGSPKTWQQCLFL